MESTAVIGDVCDVPGTSGAREVERRRRSATRRNQRARDGARRSSRSRCTKGVRWPLNARHEGRRGERPAGKPGCSRSRVTSGGRRKRRRRHRRRAVAGRTNDAGTRIRYARRADAQVPHRRPRRQPRSRRDARPPSGPCGASVLDGTGGVAGGPYSTPRPRDRRSPASHRSSGSPPATRVESVSTPRICSSTTCSVSRG